MESRSVGTQATALTADPTPLQAAPRRVKAHVLAAEICGPDTPARKPKPQAPVPVTIRRAALGTGRNDPCPCGSGKKFKRCHLRQGPGYARAA